VNTLVALYAGIDDATLETVASKGVLRRAMADADKASIEQIGESEITGTVDGATVRLDGKGLPKSRCSCPAPNICRHRVALVLALRSLGDSSSAATPEIPTDWPARLTVFDPAALSAAIGKPGFREALRIHALTESVEVEMAATSLRVILGMAKETIEVSIPAAGDFAVIASGLPPRRQPASHAAAVLAARRHFGLDLAEPDGLAPAIETEDFQPDGALLAKIGQVLCTAYRHSFAVPSPALEERLGLLAISGRAEALPRLAASLKRIAAGLEQRRLRQVGHDPAALLAELGFAHALVHALDRAPDSERRRSLAGAMRAEYRAEGDLALTGLGAELFETATGARGVTAHFLEVATGRRFTASFARGSTNDTGFDPRAAFSSEPVWGQRLSRLATATFRLTGAKASETGRLSLTQEARAEDVVPFAPTREQLDAWLGASEAPVTRAIHAAWPVLAEHLGACFAPALAAPPPAAVPVILYPARIAPVAFDDLSQSLSWPLMDQAGNWLALSLDYDEAGSGLGARRIAALEAALGDAGAAKPFAIVALARPDGEKLSLAPLALWSAAQTLLDFPPRAVAPERGLVGSIVARLRRAADRFAPPPPADSTDRKLALLAQTVLDGLVEIAEDGNGLASRARKLPPLAQAFEIAALQPLADLIDRAAHSEEPSAAADALAAAWGVTTVQGLARRLPVWR